MVQSWRVATYNTWKGDGSYTERLNWMTEGLKRLSVDLICVQEAFHCPEKQVDTAAHFADRLNLQLEVLPARQKPRRFQGAHRESWSNLAILSKTRLRRARDIRLAEHSLDRDRWAMQIVTEVPNYGVVRIINTHLTHLQDAQGAQIRAEQAHSLAQLAKDASEDVVILMGDLNATLSSTDLAPLTEPSWLSAQNDAGGGTRIGAGLGQEGRRPRIDHILVRSLTPGRVKFVHCYPALDIPCGPRNQYPSDHAALVAELEFASGQGGAD